MKCPKCEYLAFETGDRCRNCGYEFALSSVSSGPNPLDLPLAGPDAEPLIPSPDVQTHVRQTLDLNRMIGDAPADLPLFGDHDSPLITTAAAPRAPLGVRRATPEVPRARVRQPRTSDDIPFDAPVPSNARGRSRQSAVQVISDRAATPSSRMMAAFIDGLILIGLDAAVLYFTLRLCNLTADDILQLPVVPLAAFLLLLNGGYLIAFTAVGGQSIGKMAAGIKVVDDEDRPVPVAQATLRTIAYLASALPFGAGFLPGFLGGDGLALHDRLAHTRVVRPSSL